MTFALVNLETPTFRADIGSNVAGKDGSVSHILAIY